MRRTVFPGPFSGEGMAVRFYRRFPSSQPMPESATRLRPPATWVARRARRATGETLIGWDCRGGRETVRLLPIKWVRDLLGAAPRKPLTQWDEEQGIFVA